MAARDTDDLGESAPEGVSVRVQVMASRLRYFALQDSDWKKRVAPEPCVLDGAESPER